MRSNPLESCRRVCWSRSLHGRPGSVAVAARSRLRREAAEAAARVPAPVAGGAAVEPVGAAQPIRQVAPLPPRRAPGLVRARDAQQLVLLRLRRRDGPKPPDLTGQVPRDHAHRLVGGGIRR